MTKRKTENGVGVGRASEDHRKSVGSVIGRMGKFPFAWLVLVLVLMTSGFHAKTAFDSDSNFDSVASENQASESN